MQLDEGKARFIESWGKLGSSWGVCRTMAQLHALLLVSSRPLCADELMEALQVSRGNVNMNLHALMDWNLVHKVLKPGCRKEFFAAEKDMMAVLKEIIRQRKKKELDPMLRVLSEVSVVHGECPESEEFCQVVKDLKLYTDRANRAFESILNSKNNWIHNTFFKVLN